MVFDDPNPITQFILRSRGDESLFLHRSCVPLAEAVLNRLDTQGAFDFCEEGRCEF